MRCVKVLKKPVSGNRWEFHNIYNDWGEMRDWLRLSFSCSEWTHIDDNVHECRAESGGKAFVLRASYMEIKSADDVQYLLSLMLQSELMK